jgi:hypothetical protein
MRRANIVSGILLILSTIDFAVTAPVLVQEKRQTSANVVHIPHDVTTVGKRGAEEIEKLLEVPFGTWKEPAKSLDAHMSSSPSPPPVPGDHGSMDDSDVKPGPGPNPASSPAHPAAMGPLSPSPEAYLSEYWTNLLKRPIPAAPKEMGLFGQAHGDQVDYVPEPPTDADYRNYWTNQPPLKQPKLASSEEFGQADGDQVVHAQQPNINLKQLKDSGLADWFGLDDIHWQPELSSSKEFDHLQAHEDPVVQAQQPSPGPLNDLALSDWSGLGLDDILPLE